MLKILVVSFFFLLSGCVAPVVITGIGVASVATNEATGKTMSDHVVSSINGQDCRLSRTGKEDICQDDYTVKLQITNTSAKTTSVADIESKYRQ